MTKTNGSASEQAKGHKVAERRCPFITLSKMAKRQPF